MAIGSGNCTVKQAVEDWLRYGLNARAERTKTTNRILCDPHVIPYLGARKLRELSADDVDEWLADRAVAELDLMGGDITERETGKRTFTRLDSVWQPLTEQAR